MKICISIVAFLLIFNTSLVSQSKSDKIQPTTQEIKPKPNKVIEKAVSPVESDAQPEIVYDEVDELPVYKIGNKAFYSLMRRNFEALQSEGITVDKTMLLQFVVGVDGKVRSMEVFDEKGKKVTDSPTLSQHIPYWGIGRKTKEAVSPRMRIPIASIIED